MIIFLVALILIEVGMIALFISENKEMKRENETINKKKMEGE